MTPVQDWQVTSEEALAKGITLLEASAGTGKTYNIASLLLRLVAEREVKMRELVVVTFTRAATAELKERIRVRLGEAVEALEGRRDPGADEVLRFLCAGGRSHPAWLRNLRLAQETFDECLISTIHGFCDRMLQQNAFESRTDFGLELLDDTSLLREEMVDDWLTANLHAEDADRYEFLTEWCRFSRECLETLARIALQDPDSAVLPDYQALTADSWATERDGFLAQWETDWGAQLPDFFEQAHRRGAFANQGQTKYRKSRVTKEVAALTEWLRSRPSFTSVFSKAEYWSTQSLSEALAEDQELPSHAALTALRRLLRFPERLVGCEKAAFVRWVREQFAQRLRARRAQSFQDLLRNLYRVLDEEAHPSRNALIEAVGNRYRAALIDEFQDTDALQWRIFCELFGRASHWLYLIGDPKQAIYAFRGANVHVYLHAKKAAGNRVFTLRTNFRSDARMVEAFNRVLGQEGFFCEPGIDYPQVEAAAPVRGPIDRLRWKRPWTDPYTAPWQLRFLDQRLAGAWEVSEADSPMDKGLLDALIPARVAGDLLELLREGVGFYDPDAAEADPEGYRPLRAGDVAVLTRTGTQAVKVKEALTAARIPAVLRADASVWKSEEALELQRWLEALAAPGHDEPARTAATTRLFGREATLIARVDAQDPVALRDWELWLSRLVRWREVVATGGFQQALRTAFQEDLLPAQEAAEAEDVTTRLLRRAEGDRILTNVWHLAELLHQAETRQRLRLPGLLSWLKRQRAESSFDGEAAECRLERDDEAVVVMTMHKAKGLEFPVVFVPYSWDTHPPKDDKPGYVPYGDPPTGRLLDLRAAPDRQETSALAKEENQKEELRLLYVACTRAKVRCVAYVGDFKLLAFSPLASAFHAGVVPEGQDRLATAAERADTASRSELWSDLESLAHTSLTSLPGAAPTIALSPCSAVSAEVWEPASAVAGPLQVRNFLREGLDSTWRRHSYSSLSQHKPSAVLVEEEGVDFDDEAGIERATRQAESDLPRYAVSEQDPSVPLGDFDAGAEAGTFFHSVFEKADFSWAQPEQGGTEGPEKLRALLQSHLVQQGYDAAHWLDTLLDGLLATLRTPLGGPLGGARLCDVPAAARLNELRFDFPIAGGNSYGEKERGEAVAFIAIVEALRLRKTLLKPKDEATIRRAYLEALPRFGKLAGFMTGSMDLVFRHGTSGSQRWYLVDYKSNRLDPFQTQRCALRNFCREGMRYAMERGDYYLQYHIYLLALHRYLRVRLGPKNYSYDEHVGGAYYLFFRGMVGEGTPLEGDRRYGCFYDKPPFKVIEELDRIFARCGDDAGGSTP